MTDTRTDPLAHIKAGDAPLAFDIEGFADCPATQGSFICTRPAGHLGQHIASAFTQIAAVWTDEA